VARMPPADLTTGSACGSGRFSALEDQRAETLPVQRSPTLVVGAHCMMQLMQISMFPFRFPLSILDQLPLLRRLPKCPENFFGNLSLGTRTGLAGQLWPDPFGESAQSHPLRRRGEQTGRSGLRRAAGSRLKPTAMSLRRRSRPSFPTCAWSRRTLGSRLKLSIGSTPISQRAIPQLGRVNSFYGATKEASPYVRAQDEVVSVQIDDVLPTSQNSWQVDWTETTRDRKGEKALTAKWRVTIVLVPPSTSTSEAQLRRNPLGVYVQDITWSRLN
jgi:hypothetical protein